MSIWNADKSSRAGVLNQGISGTWGPQIFLVLGAVLCIVEWFTASPLHTDASSTIAPPPQSRQGEPRASPDSSKQPPGNILGSTTGEWCYRHLVSRGRGCCETPHITQDSSPTTEFPVPNVNGVRSESPNLEAGPGLS